MISAVNGVDVHYSHELNGSSGCFGTWKLGLRGQFEKVVCHPCETLKPKSVEQFRVSVKGNISFICVSRECAP